MTTKKKTLAAFLFFIAIFGSTHFLDFPGSLSHLNTVSNGQKILDLKPAFTTDEVYQRLDAFGEEGRQATLQTMITIDTIFPLSAFIFFSCLAGVLKKRLLIICIQNITGSSLPYIYQWIFWKISL